MIAKGTLVRVEWEDICDLTNDDWNDDLEADTAGIVSLGWVAKDYSDRERKLLVGKDWSPDDGKYRSVIAFPVGCIIGVTELHTGRELWDASPVEECVEE